MERGVMILEAQRIASGCPLSDLRAQSDDTTVVSLDDRALAATFYAYNRLLHVPPTSFPIGGPLVTDTDFAAADRTFEKCRPLPVAIDNALSTEALVGAATFQPRRDNLVGHLGPHFEEGLACEPQIATADALRRALPRKLEGLGFAELWAYRRVQGGSGTDLHADIGAVSAHLWIMPDQARSILKLVGSNARVLGSNVERGGIRPPLVGKDDPIAVPRRFTRLVLFEANLFDRTSLGRFKFGV